MQVFIGGPKNKDGVLFWEKLNSSTNRYRPVSRKFHLDSTRTILTINTPVPSDVGFYRAQLARITRVNGNLRAHTMTTTMELILICT